IDAMLWFVNEILPVIRDRLRVRLTILGSNPPDEVRRLAGPDVTVTGYVPEVGEYFRQARVFVAPLRYGAGVKGKVGQAMTFGLPVVTTTIGAEGMGIVDDVHALIRDEPVGFAAAVISLMTSPEQWERISSSSRLLVEDFSPQRMLDRLQKMLARL